MIFFEGMGSEPTESAEHRALFAERPTSPYGKVLARHSGVISSYADELRGYVLKQTEAGTYQHIHFFERGFESTSKDYPTLHAAIVGAFQDASSRRGYWSEPWLNRLTMDASLPSEELPEPLELPELTLLGVSTPEDPESPYGRALAKYSLDGEVRRSYGDEQQGILIQRYAPESHRYIFYRMDGTASAAPDSFATELDAARDAYEAASKYQKFWLHTHRNSHWLRRLKADAERAAAGAEASNSTRVQKPRSGEGKELAESKELSEPGSVEGIAVAEDPDSPLGKVLSSPRYFGPLVAQYGDEQQGFVINRFRDGYITVRYREGRYDEKSHYFPDRLTAVQDCLRWLDEDWLKANRKTEWAKRLKADARPEPKQRLWSKPRNPAEPKSTTELAELEGDSARPISESAYGKALTSPKRTGDVVTRYGDDDRGILIERTPEGYAAVFYREAHPLSLSSLRFDTRESAALGALTTAKGVYGDWLKANRKTEWAKRLRADAKSYSRKMLWG